MPKGKKRRGAGASSFADTLHQENRTDAVTDDDKDAESLQDRLAAYSESHSTKISSSSSSSAAGVAGSRGAGSGSAGAAAVSSSDRLVFGRDHFAGLSVDPFFRTLPNSRKIGCAVIRDTATGTKEALVVVPPKLEGEAATGGAEPQPPRKVLADGAEEVTIGSKYRVIIPNVRPLASVREVHPFGATRWEATTPGGTAMVARRYEEVRVEDAEGEYDAAIAHFSPKPSSGRVYWGVPSDRREPIIRGDLKGEDKEEVEKDAKETPPKFKGGAVLEVDNPSVPWRKAIPRRKPSQNEVMGQSAVEEFRSFVEMYSDALNPKIVEYLRKCADTHYRGKTFETNWRPEWLHLYGFGLTPKDLNPQVKTNLGAAPKFANTEMMILEHIGQWLATTAVEKGIDLSVRILPLFEMILGSDVVRHIEFFMQASMEGRTVTLHQSIDPLAPGIFRKKSDVGAGTAAVAMLLKGEAPHSVVPVAAEAGGAAMAAAGGGAMTRSARRRAVRDGDPSGALNLTSLMLSRISRLEEERASRAGAAAAEGAVPRRSKRLRSASDASETDRTRSARAAAASAREAGELTSIVGAKRTRDFDDEFDDEELLAVAKAVEDEIAATAPKQKRCRRG